MHSKWSEDMANVLIVEDELPIAELLSFGLSRAGYRCEYVLDGEAAADLLEEQEYDLVLLDIMLPKVDGYELFEFISYLKIPVIFITAKGTLQDRLRGLRMGADDYIVKPFELEEIVARVQAVLRRTEKMQKVIRVGDLIMVPEKRLVKKGEKEIILTSKEYDLLFYLAMNKEQLLYREQLFEKVWQVEFTGDTRTLDLHIQRIRKKLGDKDMIRTVYGEGYLLKG